MGLLNLLSGEAMQNAAMGMLRNHMIKGGVTLVALEKVESGGNATDGFNMHHFTEPVTIITNKDLATYKSAVEKCIEHGIKF